MLDEARIINGQYGECWSEGNWMTNVTGVEASVAISKEQIRKAGSRWIGHKTTSLEGTGTIQSYKVTTEWIEKIGSVANDRGKPFITELIVKLDDPEAWGAMRIRLKHVQFDTIPLINYDLNSLVEEELQFTFSGYDLLDRIVADN